MVRNGVLSYYSKVPNEALGIDFDIEYMKNHKEKPKCTLPVSGIVKILTPFEAIYEKE